jgi:adenosylhomocysteine nucleosidase
MLKILITCAVREEFFEIKWPDTEVYYVLTGIGKAKAAYRVAEAINHVQPDLVVNAGTAGTIVHQVGDIFVCKTFVDRDMAKLKDFGLESEISTTDYCQIKGFVKNGARGRM